MKHALRLSLPLAAALVVAGCGASPDEQFAEARAAFAAEDFNAARISLTAALREQPGSKAMLALLARAQVRLGDGEGALASLGKLKALGVGGADIARIEAEARLLKAEPDKALALLGTDGSAEAWRLRAAAHLDKGDPLRSLAAFRSGLAAGADARLAGDYGWFLLSANALDEARAELAKLKRMAPGGYQALMLEAAILLRQGQAKPALALYEQAAERFPTRFEPQLGESEALEALGRLDDAAASVARAEELAPGHPKVTSARLRVAAVQGKWDKVRATLQTGEASLDPQSPEGLLYAEALLRLGFVEQARAQVKRTVLLQPGNLFARRLLGEAQLAGNDAAGAVESLAPLASAFQVTPEEMVLLEKAARAAGSPLVDGWQALAASPQLKQRSAQVMAGEKALQEGRWDKAVAAFRGLAAMEENGWVLTNLAYALARSGNGAEAVAVADRAMAAAPDDPAALKAAALARIVSATDLARAETLLVEALRLWPMDLEAALLLDRLRSGAG
ncbi:MAG: hypothetical protein RIQ46_1965 [Pseudomonadota bacterium]